MAVHPAVPAAGAEAGAQTTTDLRDVLDISHPRSDSMGMTAIVGAGAPIANSLAIASRSHARIEFWRAHTRQSLVRYALPTIKDM